MPSFVTVIVLVISTKCLELLTYDELLPVKGVIMGRRNLHNSQTGESLELTIGHNGLCILGKPYMWGVLEWCGVNLLRIWSEM